MNKIFQTLRQLWIHFRKFGGDVIDLMKPKNQVEACLIYANGPRKGEVYRRYKGRNVVTGWLSVDGAAPTSGRDMMRRIVVPTGFAGSLAADSNAVIDQLQLGTGTTAETSNDTALVTPIVASEKTFSSVTYDGTNPYVTFVADYAAGEVNNVVISEAALLSARTPQDFIARKTFGGFTKTSDFTLQIRWTIRF